MHPRLLRRPVALAATAAAVTLAACNTKTTARNESPPTDTATMGGRTDIADAQIASLIVAAHSGDSAAGVLGRTRGGKAIVREFAAMLARDHGAANRVAAPLARRLGPPPDSGDIREMREDAADDRTGLAGKSGEEFDRAFIEHEVDVHRRLLEKIDLELLLAADDPELKQLLTATRPVVAAHLERALDIQRQIDDDPANDAPARRP